MLGLIAVAALAVYALYFYALIKLIPITLTLPGIAGLILTIGVAADANIVIFERVKEEIRAREIDSRRDRDRLPQGPDGDHRRQRGHDHDRVHPVRAGHLRGPGLRLHARDRDVRVAVHGRAGDAGDPDDDGRLAHDRAAVGARARAARSASGRSTSWAPRRYFFSMSGVILLIGALAIGGRGPEPGHRLHLGHADHRQPGQAGHRGAGQLDRDRGRRRPDPMVQKITQQGAGHDVFQISSKQLRPQRASSNVQTALHDQFGEATVVRRHHRSARRSARRSPTAR